jgi:hypothetical protein
MSPLMARSRARWTGRACPLCPGTSDINLFCYRESIIHLDPKISNRALYFGVTEQELDRTKIKIPQRSSLLPYRGVLFLSFGNRGDTGQ